MLFSTCVFTSHSVTESKTTKIGFFVIAQRKHFDFVASVFQVITSELSSLPAILHVGKKKKRKELKTRSVHSKECGLLASSASILFGF